MFAGSDVATAMTHKSISVYGLEYNFKWADLDRLLLAGVCPLEYDPGRAYRVCQSITTWLKNDKYNRREVSVRRTADYVARQVRDRLDQDFVGSKGTATTLISIKNATISVLTQMSRAELLAGDAANPPFKNIQCRLEGDTCWVDFECSPVIPINYIPVTIHLTVFTSTVTG
jgi:phage tail sheath gpL-like